MDDIRKRAAEHWSRRINTGKRRWWTSPTIHRHINRIVCGEAISGAWAGLTHRMAALPTSGRFQRGISVGCGNGAKEIALVERGLVQAFDLYEISQVRVQQGHDIAKAKGVESRVHFHLEDAFKVAPARSYDLVYWNNALHHMLDVARAVEWSRERLWQDGWFVMDDFVGPARFQWTDANLLFASGVRTMLPKSFLVDPTDPTKVLPIQVGRPNAKDLIADDPTEAADSDRILASVRKTFPNAEVILTGGCLYHTALNDVLAHFDEEADASLLNAILMADEALARAGESQYAVALARA